MRPANQLECRRLHTYTRDDIPPANADLEHIRVFGKLVGVIDPSDLAITVQR
jgi:hypothetical protein